MARFAELEDVQHAHQELMDAGLTRQELTRHYAAEVDLGKCTITLRRRKECWAVRSSVGLPFEISQELNREWGKRIRVRGSGWNTPLKEGEAVLLWEVDDPEALRVLIETLRDHFAVAMSAS
jgi:hypothetical protein